MEQDVFNRRFYGRDEMNVNINIEGATTEILESLIGKAVDAKYPKDIHDTILNREITGQFNLQSVLEEVVQHYFKRSLEKRGGNMAKVTHDLGFDNYQTCCNWARKYQVK